jgi:hypothetical protein
VSGGEVAQVIAGGVTASAYRAPSNSMMAVNVDEKERQSRSGSRENKCPAPAPVTLVTNRNAELKTK